MGPSWTHLGSAFATAFAASLVECIEALTVVLAVGATRGWRSVLIGVALAIAALSLTATLLGPTLRLAPLRALHLILGGVLLAFGLRWLHKAVLRAAGSIPKRNESSAYLRVRERFEHEARATRTWDPLAFGAAFHATVLEGVEVLVIVIAIGAGGEALSTSAALGALTAFFIVVALGFALHRPLARAPENGLKFGVGVVTTGLGIFWLGDGAGLAWPEGDWFAAALIVAVLISALTAVRWVAQRRPSRANGER